MNRSRPHHNIYGLRLEPRYTALHDSRGLKHHLEAGYTLVALLAVMTIMALFALAVAPSLVQQTQREREKEAIFRGEQVADAITSYYVYRRSVLGLSVEQALPTSVDQLLEGVPIPGGTKKRQVLRISATRDPLSPSGEWGYVAPRSQKLIDFQQAVMLYSGSLIPEPNITQIKELQLFSAPQLLPGGVPMAPNNSDDSSDDTSGPFVGVSSRSRNSSVLYYYGIDQHNHWVFTPLFRR
jgi:type II secretory pathway pseudopilin PulG